RGGRWWRRLGCVRGRRGVPLARLSAEEEHREHHPDEERRGQRQEGGQTPTTGKIGPEGRDQECRSEREAYECRPDEPESDLVSGGESGEKHAARELPQRGMAPPRPCTDLSSGVFVQCGNERRHRCLRNS